jgi:Leucine-rich repeat (LRR) protein
MDVSDLTLDEATGRLVMKYRGLTELDMNVFECIDVKRIIHLDLSYNNLHSLPTELELLSNLQFLNCSWNRLVSLPSILGSFVSFRTLIAAKNRISHVTDDIGKCSSLQYLDLSDNQLQTVPESLCNCTRLRVIYLQNNQLITLPSGLAQLRGHGFLEDLNVTGNPRLEIIPEPVRAQANVILWILSLFYESENQLDHISRKTNEYHVLLQSQERKLVQERERYTQLLEDKDRLLKERNSAKWFLMVLGWKEKCLHGVRMMSSEIAALFALRTNVKIDPHY